MNEYIERMKQELLELETKLLALQTFLITDTFKQLGQIDQGLMRNQADLMTEYSVVLARRIERATEK